MNRITDVEITNNCEQKTKCPEPKIHPKKKLYRYEIAAHDYDDRNPIMREIMGLDPDAHFKIKSKWRFRVETSLDEHRVLSLLTRKKDPFDFKKVWFM